MGGIVGVSVDPMDRVLADLSAESRALLELSVRRGIPDDEIASLLHTPESEVRSRREAVMQEVADSLGEEPDEDLREQVVEHLGDRGNLFAPPPGAEAPPAERPRRRGRLVPALMGGLLIAAVVAVVLALAGGDDEKPQRRTLQLGPAAQLEPLPGMPPATGRARLVRRDRRDRLELRVTGLPRPRGRYEVWLYSSVSQAESLGSFPTGDIELDALLPRDADRYRDIDISLEPADANDNHSGDSYLRVPLARLRP
jgi:anti-sigma-K factor RskA